VRASRFFRASLAAFTISTSAFADPAATGVLSYDAAFFAEARPNTAYDMIGRLPGFSFTDVGSARGFAGTAGNVLIDGERPTSKTDSLQSVLTRIPAGNVERIDLIRGGAPGIDMQGQTVVANVILKAQDSLHVIATADDYVFLDGHMIPTASLQFTQHSGGTTYEGTISGVQSYDDSVGRGTHDVFDGSGHLLTHDVTQSHGLGVGISANGAITLPLLGGEFKTNFTLQDSPFVDALTYRRPGFLETFGDRSRDNGSEFGLHWQGPLGGTQLETLVLQRLDHTIAASDSNDGTTAQHFDSTTDTGESIARATLRYSPLTELTFEGGAEMAYNFLGGKTGFLINGVNQPLPSAIAHVQELRGEVFSQGTWKISNQWLLEAGARAEYSRISESGTDSESRTFFYPKPRLVLTWSPSSGTQVRLRYEKVVGQLDFNNFVASANLSSTGVTVGNKDIKPDQHSQYELSVERHFWDKGAVVLTFMHEDIKDVVDFVPIKDALGNLFDAPGNIGNGQDNQITFQATLPLDRLFVPNGLLTTTSIFNLTSVRDPVTGVNRVISLQRLQNVNVSFSQDIDSLKSTWGINYYNCWDEYSYRLTTSRHRKVTPTYFQAFWEYKPSAAWSYRFQLNNFTDFVYHDNNFTFGGPRNVSPLIGVDEYNGQSIPQFEFRIRWTY
jgi:outer membrane receptor protein involved in Fe transport